MAMAAVLTAATSQHTEHLINNNDIWSDNEAIQFLQQLHPLETYTQQQLQHLYHRTKPYSWDGQHLWRNPSGKHNTKRWVPQSHQRQYIITQQHSQIGHLGRDITYTSLANAVWWPGLYKDVAHTVASCADCDRAKARFDASLPTQLTPIPIKGLFYRWHIDLIPTVKASRKRSTTVMVCVESFSKWTEFFRTPQERLQILHQSNGPDHQQIWSPRRGSH